MATAEQIREHYDSLAFVYQTFWGDHIHHGFFVTGDEKPADAQIQMLEHCVRLARIQDGIDVLDVGCGHGGTSVYLADHHRCKTLGLTLSDKQRRIAETNAAKAGVSHRASFMVGNADYFEFPESRYDLVWTMESSEHFADKTKYLRNVSRTLRQDGRLLLAAWTGPMERPRIQEVARAFLCPELWTSDQYTAACLASGLKVLECEDVTLRVIRTWEICLERARAAGPVVKLLPAAAREFVEGIDIILEAYRSGDLSYTLLVAQK